MRRCGLARKTRTCLTNESRGFEPTRVLASFFFFSSLHRFVVVVVGVVVTFGVMIHCEWGGT